MKRWIMYVHVLGPLKRFLVVQVCCIRTRLRVSGMLRVVQVPRFEFGLGQPREGALITSSCGFPWSNTGVYWTTASTCCRKRTQKPILRWLGDETGRAWWKPAGFGHFGSLASPQLPALKAESLPNTKHAARGRGQPSHGNFQPFTAQYLQLQLSGTLPNLSGKQIASLITPNPRRATTRIHSNAIKSNTYDTKVNTYALKLIHTTLNLIHTTSVRRSMKF